MKKYKILLKKEYTQDLYNTYPNAFDIKEMDVQKRINSNFIKLMEINKDIQTELIQNLGVTYIGYLHLLVNTLGYDNSVNFKKLIALGIKEGMMKVVKKKLITANAVKKYNGVFYLNPVIAIKGETIDPEIINLFTNQ